jgi:predicted ferric reductase
VSRARAILPWAVLAAAVIVPLAIAATSPHLQWRGPVYIGAGFAGIIAMGLLLVQPLLAGGYLPGLPARRSRRVHRLIGIGLLSAVILHVVGLWITSPPDVVDALLFRSPTPFSAWGVIAMWAVMLAAVLAMIRHRLGPRLWRAGHTFVVAIVVVTSIVHALLIEGTMEMISKVVLCALVLAATVKVIADLRAWVLVLRRKT